LCTLSVNLFIHKQGSERKPPLKRKASKAGTSSSGDEKVPSPSAAEMEIKNGNDDKAGVSTIKSTPSPAYSSDGNGGSGGGGGGLKLKIRRNSGAKVDSSPTFVLLSEQEW